MTTISERYNDVDDKSKFVGTPMIGSGRVVSGQSALGRSHWYIVDC